MMNKINMSIFFATLLYVGINVLTHTVNTNNLVLNHNQELISTLAMLDN